MAQIGDRIEAVSPRPGRRGGVVTGVNGPMLMVRWDSGEQSGLIPSAGVLRVVGHLAAAPASGKRKGGKKR
jgi:hypothetical protein